MIRHLYQEAGYEVQNDSFATELSSVNGDQNQSENNNNSLEDHEEIKERDNSPLDRTRLGNFPTFYKIVNLENNKSIKRSQFENVKPGMLQKNKNYTTSSDSESSASE